MAYFVCIFEMVDKEKDALILDEHKAFLQKYLDEGIIYAKGPFTDHTGGLVIYKTETYDEAYRIASSDPVIAQKTRNMIFKEWKSTLPA
jgi:uncharacterized protein